MASSGIKTLVFGGQGWIGSHVFRLFDGRKDIVPMLPPPDMRLDDTRAVAEYLDLVRPDRVLCLVGRTHGPGCDTIDYLEQPGRLVENLRDNLYAPVSLALLCVERHIHVTYMGTGCIFSNDAPDDHAPYTEDALPDFFGSSYSVVKGYTDRLVRLLGDSVLNVRIRMPITADWHRRNFVTKIVRYEKVCSMPNSMSVLDDVLPVMIDMMREGRTGTVNLVNPGFTTHDEILGMYRDIVDPNFTWKNFSQAEQDELLASKRSNNVLDTATIETEFPHVPHVRDGVRRCLEAMAAEKRRWQQQP